MAQDLKNVIGKDDKVNVMNESEKIVIGKDDEGIFHPNEELVQDEANVFYNELSKEDKKKFKRNLGEIAKAIKGSLNYLTPVQLLNLMDKVIEDIDKNDANRYKPILRISDYNFGHLFCLMAMQRNIDNKI